MDFILIIIGFAILIIGAHFLVDGASGLAKRFNVPNIIIGLTVVAFGTSAPELVVNLVAAFDPGSTDIALTNIIGSNTINTYIILGVAALIFPITSLRSSRRFSIPLSVFAPLIVLLMSVGDNIVSRADGFILLIFFVWFMIVMVRNTLSHPKKSDEEDYKPVKIWLASIMIIGGLGALVGGAQLIVPSATRIAVSLGISQAVIGLTIVALGTSLPELATSVVAAFKKNSDIALGNVIGSNIFNVFFVLGLSATIQPLPAYKGMVIDLIIAILASLLVLIFVYTNKQHKIKRWQGGLLVAIYTAYLVWMISGL
ncbi:MAG TPA: calcium/sodium antiporter [Paludibacter sp.]|nr:calcium/sodium antiporter [Paludibacter sp.]